MATGGAGPMGIFDSGFGGLTVFKGIRRLLPQYDYVYLGDNANAPYGRRAPADIYALTIAGVKRLFAGGCDLVILACNTASAAALKRMQETWLPPGKRVLGVFVPLIEALTERQWGHGNALPDRIILFQGPHEREAEDEDDLIVSLGETLIHESITGSRFLCEIDGLTRVGPYDAVIPAIAGQAWITGLSQIGLDPSDPYPEGFTLTDTWMGPV